MKLSFLSLASGSSGNCYYLGTSEFGMLIDAGIGIRTIKKVLKDRSIDFTKIVAVLITHDHADIWARSFAFLSMRQPTCTGGLIRAGMWRRPYVSPARL